MKPRESTGSPGAGVTDGLEVSNVGAKNQIQILCKSFELSYQ